MRVPGSTQCLDFGIFPWAAAKGLGRMGAVAVPSLIDELVDDSPLVRELAAEALGRIGPGAISAAPALGALRTDPDERVRSEALRALRKIGWKSDAKLSVWSELLNSGDEFERNEAIKALRQMGGEVFPALNVIIAAVEHQQDWTIRWRAISTLRNLGTTAHEAVPALSNALSDSVHFVQCYAALALFKIAPEEPRVLKNDIQLGGDSLLIFIEKRIDEKWVCASDKTKHRFFDEFEGLIPGYELRFLEIEGNARWNFEALIKRGATDGVGMTIAARGFPMDISAEVLAEVESTDGGLCHSWLTLQELQDYDDAKDPNDVDFQELIKRLETFGRADSVRIVFWLSE